MINSGFNWMKIWQRKGQYRFSAKMVPLERGESLLSNGATFDKKRWILCFGFSKCEVYPTLELSFATLLSLSDWNDHCATNGIMICQIHESVHSGESNGLPWWWTTMRYQKMEIKICPWIDLIINSLWWALRQSTALNLSCRLAGTSLKTVQYEVDS